MPRNIETFFRLGYAERIRLVAMQTRTKMTEIFDFEPLSGEQTLFDTLGEVSFVERTYAGQPNTPQQLVTGRRAISWKDYEYTTHFDWRDQGRLIRMLGPRGSVETTVTRGWAKKVDDALISSLSGTAYSGKNGETSVAFTAPDAGVTTGDQQIGIDTGGTGSNLNITKIRAGVSLLQNAWAMETDGPMGWLVAHPNQLLGGPSSGAPGTVTAGLFTAVDVTSSDYVGFQSNQTGTFGTILGLKIVSHPGIPTYTTGKRYAYIIAPGAYIYGWNMSPRSEIDELPGQGHDLQYAFYGSVAATRLFENRVVRIACDETA